jgi:hypothetical protein
MAVSGTINVSSSFLDSTDSTGVESEKKLSLASADVHTGGKIALVSGTCGTTEVAIDLTSLDYRDAAGDLVSLDFVQRMAIKADPGASAEFVDTGEKLKSLSNRASISCVNRTPDTLHVYTTAGSSTYTILFYGS